MKIKKLFYVLLFILLFSFLSYADGIMIEYIPLHYFFYKAGGVSLIITVTNINKKNGIVIGKIEKIISRNLTEYKLNNEYEFIEIPPPKLIKGKWYVYQTYWNKYEIDDIKKSIKLIVFPDYNKESVFIPYNKKTEKKLILFTNQDWKKKYEKETSDIDLLNNLSDCDLSTITYDICKKRDLLNNNIIINSYIKSEPVLKNIYIKENLLNYHLNTLDENEKIFFYTDVIKKYKVIKNKMLFYFLNNYLSYAEINNNNFETVKLFYFSIGYYSNQLLDTKRMIKTNLINFLKKDENRKYSNQINNLVLDFYKNTPEINYNYNNDLADYIGILDKKNRIQFIINLLNNINKTKIAELNNNFDEYLTERLLYGMKNYPDLEYITEIKQLEPYLHLINHNLIKEIILKYKIDFPDNNDIKSIEDMLKNHEK